MIRRYKLENFQLAPTEADDALVWVIANPTDEEKRQMIQRFDLDEHNFNSAFDPEEPARIEIEPGRVDLILKRPRNYSSKDQFLFKVSTMGLFLFKDTLLIAVSDDIDLFTGKYFKHMTGLREVYLKLIYNTISHFMEHLKVINMIADELERKISHSMENKHLLNMFSLEKSLVYYLNSISGNSFVIERLKHSSEKIGLSTRSQEFIDDIIIENQQCFRQAEIYSNIFASMVGARASIVSNNLNILMKNLNAVVIAVAVPSFFAGVGGMSELSAIAGPQNWHIAYPLFLLLMLVIGGATYLLIKRFERH
ncbi:MAG: divalent metal ion transporter [Elusimicrobia bacterium RIFOXYD12_FULL_66_9]|nr:MAG: divalent metal ion transporter [Elusimicrobia bacterium RIFOXYD12_FULL_66_9]